jgi:dipeptidyl aminopeptidase/acylaminoacyl peptidase
MKRSLAAILLVASMSTAAGADDMTEAITRVASVGRSSSPSFSPDASRIAFVSDLAGVPQIFIVPTAGGWPVQVTSGTDPVSSVAWSPKGDLLAYTVNPGGGLNVQVYVTRPDGTQVRRLTDGGKENNGLGEWSKDGRLLTITSNRRDPAAIDAYVYDVAAKKLRLVARGDGIGTITSLSDDARRAVMSRVATRGDNNLYLLDLKAKRETHLTPHRPPAQFSGLIAPRGDGVYLTTNDGRDLAAFGRMPLGKGGPGPVEVIAERTDAEPQGFVLNRAGTAAAVMWNVAVAAPQARPPQGGAHGPARRQRHQRPGDRGEQIVASLKKRGVPVEYVLFADEGHGWRKPTNRIRSTVEMTRFFVTHLRRR